MQESDSDNFERALKRLCAGFDVPMTDARRDAYWRSFRKLQLLEFTGLVDMALVESTFASMPTVGALWELHRKIQAPTQAKKASGPSIQEQLCEYAAKTLWSRLSPLEMSTPWTYVYREWMQDGKQCAECIGVVIEKKDGTRLGITVADMQHAAAA